MVFKNPGLSAIIYCSAQEYDTPSTTNEGDHCENRTEAARTSPLCLLSIREKVKRRWRQSVGSHVGNLGLQCPRPGTPNFGSLGLQCPRPGTPSLGNTIRVRALVSRIVSPVIGEKLQEAFLTAPEGAGGSKLHLLGKRCGSSVDLRD